MKEYYTIDFEGYDPKGKFHRVRVCTCYKSENAADKALCNEMNKAEEEGWSGLQGGITYHE